MRITIPIRTVSASNAHELPFARAIRVKRERRATSVMWMAAPNAERCRARGLGSWAITLTRSSPGTRQLDSDNLPPSLKAIRDELARGLGLDDGDQRIRWEYQQRRGPWAVIVDIEELRREGPESSR